MTRWQKSKNRHKIMEGPSKLSEKKRRKTPKHRHGHSGVVAGEGDDGASHAGTITTNKTDSEERRRARTLRKLKEHYATLGLDENGDPLDNFSLLQFPVREWKFTLPGTRDKVAMNPVVTVLAIVCLWSFVLWANVDPIGASTRLVSWREGLTFHFTWFYQISKAVMFFFIMYITYRYGHIHLGRKADKPEFSSITYFCMIFAANVGSSLLTNGAIDPLTFQTDHYYAKAGYRSQDELDMFAVNAVLNNWGIGSWVSITLVAVCASLAGYRFLLPFTFRASFFPILGAYTWGWMGDVIDTLAVVAATACTCAMLGSTAILCTAGLVHLGLVDGEKTDSEIASIQSVVVWVVTIVSTISVLSGLHGGLQYMPLIAMFFGLVVTFLVFATDDTKFMLNLMVQETGYFLQNSLFQLNFWTDAFGQLRDGSGRAIDGKAAETWWTGAWPIAFQAWASCLAPVVGLFIAYISRGRKLWEVVLYSFFAPILALLVWSCIWAGVALRQTRQALELMGLGELFFNNSGHFLADGSELCYDVPQEDVVVDGEVVFTNYLPGVSPVCSFNPDDASTTSYSIFESMHGMGTALSLLYLLGFTFFYIAHSDSSTFIIDTLASNGRKNYHWSRRMFWAGTVAALSTTLVSPAKGDAASAVNSFALLCGFPMVILLCYLMQSTVLLCQAADKIGDTDDDTEFTFPNQPVFGTPVFGGVFNVIEYLVSLGKVNDSRVELGMHQPTREQLVEFGVGLCLPFVSLFKIMSATYPQNTKSNMATVVCYGICFLGWLSLALASLSYPGLYGVSVTLFTISGLILASIRSSFRERHGIRSNTIADLVCGTLLWPQVLVQMSLYRETSANATPKADINSSSHEKKQDNGDIENDQMEA